MWAITVVSRYLPGASCLTQALAALTLLGNVDRTIAVRIGIAKEAGGALTAHAWVEMEGKVLMGNMLGLSRYAILSPIEGQRISERDIRNT